MLYKALKCIVLLNTPPVAWTSSLWSPVTDEDDEGTGVKARKRVHAKRGFEPGGALTAELALCFFFPNCFN